MRKSRSVAVLLVAAAIMGLAPLAGLAILRLPFHEYLRFPPRAHFVPHAAFEWSAFAVLGIPMIAAVALYGIALAVTPRLPNSSPQARFPGWAWSGLGLLAGSWLLSWQEGALPPEWRRHVFTPLWLGYVLVMNGLVFRRQGRSLLTHRTRWFIALFPVSAAFWWLFEYLNQFVANWYYTGIAAQSDWDYFLQGTLPFSTVLPAVASTWAWLDGFRRFEMRSLAAIQGKASWGWGAIVAGTLALMGIGIWPESLFPALWLAPLLLLGGLQPLLSGESYFAPLSQGDWKPLLQPALAALICGALWEMWNYGSLAKWHYSIPYVQRFPVFEMPLLGYAGYLPFGVECALILDLVARIVERRPAWPLD